MFRDKVLLLENLENFDYERTKNNVHRYFAYLQKLGWQLEKLNLQKGLTANYDFLSESEKQPYIPVGKDEFDLSAKEYKEEQIKKRMSSYYWAKSSLSYMEQIYIEERFVNRKKEKELVDLLGISNSDSNEFRILKRSAIYKFADFFNLVVEKEADNKEKVLKKELRGRCRYGQTCINR